MSISARDLEQIATRLDSHEDRLDDLETQEFLQPGVAGLGWSHIETKSGAGTGASGVYDFTNIPATHTHLKIIYSLRTDRSAPGDTLQVEVNGDTTGGNYNSFRWLGTQVDTFDTDENVSGAAIFLVYIVGNTAPANEFAAGEILIPNYTDTDKVKEMFATGVFIGAYSTGQIHYTGGVGVWESTAAINQLTLESANPISPILSGSKASLYGLS